jgi:hypothetical protein
MGASQTLALAIEEILQGRSGELAEKNAGRSLLAGPGARLMRASDLPSPAAHRDPLPTMVPALDRLLSGGLPRGGLVEISGRRSCGLFSIGIAVLAAATSIGEGAALVDVGSHLDPQAAEEAGVDLARLLWVRPANRKKAVASAEMLLSAGFPLVVLDLGLAPARGGFVPDAAWVRLERAARGRGAALLLLAPYRVSGVAAGAVLCAGSARAIWKGAGRSPRLLDGIASRLLLQKDARARSGLAEPIALAAPGALAGSPLIRGEKAPLTPARYRRPFGPALPTAGGLPLVDGSRREREVSLPSPPGGGRGQGEGALLGWGAASPAAAPA